MQQASPEQDSRFITVFETFGNICALNVLWLLCSIPIVTIGASTTALYAVMLKLIDKEEGPVVRSFFAAFKSNFKQATTAWLIIIVVMVGICGELYFSYACGFEGTLAMFYLVLGGVELVLLCLTLPFLFPLIAKFENSIWNTFKNAFLLSVSNLGSWMKLFLAWFMSFFVYIVYPEAFYLIWYLWLILVFGLIAYGTSFTLRKVFRRIEHVQEQKKDGNTQQKSVNTKSFGQRKAQKTDKKVSIKEQANLKVK